MNIETALHNLHVLSTLQPNTKLTVDDNQKLSIDQRWLNGVRRTVTGDSKTDIIEPIKNTFTTLVRDPSYNQEKGSKLQSVLENLDEWLKTTYPAFTELYTSLTSLIKDVELENNVLETGRLLSLKLDQKNYQHFNQPSTPSTLVREDMSGEFIEFIKLYNHMIGMSAQDIDYIRTLYNNVYYDYAAREKTPLPYSPSSVKYNVLVRYTFVKKPILFYQNTPAFDTVAEEYRNIVQTYVTKRLVTNP